MTKSLRKLFRLEDYFTLRSLKASVNRCEGECEGEENENGISERERQEH